MFFRMYFDYLRRFKKDNRPRPCFKVMETAIKNFIGFVQKRAVSRLIHDTEIKPRLKMMLRTDLNRTIEYEIRHMIVSMFGK